MFKIKTKILILFISSFILSCNSKIDNSTNNEEPTDNVGFETKDSIVETKKVENLPKIDSVKMHAFDDLYFGTKDEITSKKFSINDMEYIIKSSETVPNKGLCYFMIQNQSRITTQKKANRVLNDLKNTISKKYKNPENLNKTYYIKHPEEREENDYGPRGLLYKYDAKLVGLPYEVESCKWNLKYKEILIGYFIEHKNKTVYFESSPTSDYYIIYIEFRSKVIKQKKESSEKMNIEKDSKKF